MASSRRSLPFQIAPLASLLLTGLLCPAFAAAQTTLDSQPAAETKAHYTKYEYRIPMRDGNRLFTAVYVPKDQTRKYPILLTRTPYSVRPYGADQYGPIIGPSELFDKAGYIFALQDVRGRWMSEGTYVNVRPYLKAKKGPKDVDESSDAYDTIDWLLKHVPNHNGKVGMTGISYPGFYTAAGMIDAHPALKAVSPQAPVTDWFIGDDWHHNGALFLAHNFNFLSQFDRPRPKPTKKFDPKFDHETPDGYSFFLALGPLSEVSDRLFKGETSFLKELTQHGTYDAFWKARNIRPHLKNIKPAVMTVGGWFDAENLFGALEVYKNLEKNSPKTSNRLVMGPWVHGGWRGHDPARIDDGSKLGDVPFNAKTADFYRDQIELPFFEYHLKGKKHLDPPKAWVFETGTNVWRQFASWPPKQAKPKTFYFQAAGKLADAPPAAAKASGKPRPDPRDRHGDGHGDDFDEYVSDPARPVPFIEGVNVGMPKEYMTADQRFASRRPDVLVYSGPVLDEDLSIAGPIQVDLVVSTSGTDSDWIVKLIDVYPDDYPDPSPNPRGVRMGGYQQLVRGDVMRGKFRNSFEKPEPFTPQRPAPVKFTMQDVFHTFRSGHRVMVQVQSSWFPLVDRNPQVFVDIYRAKPSDYQRATERVYRSAERSSSVTVLVAP